MISKFLQKIFKIISYNLFFIIYGKVKRQLHRNTDSRIIIETINMEKNLNYKVYKVNEGRLYTDRVHDTAVILDKKIVNGPSFQFRYTKDSESKIYNSNVEDNIVLKNGTPRRLKRLDGVVLSLLSGGAGNTNYWHWLYDVLPKLGLCSKTINLKDIDYFLLPDDIKKFQNETLDCLEIPKNKRISSVNFRHIKAKKLIVTDHPFVISGVATDDIMNMPEWISQWLKENFLKKNIIFEKKNIRKVYIDRGNPAKENQLSRSIINEDEVKEYLSTNGFSSIKLQDISFSDQVNLFYNADCIVGLHGGGFANLAFCRPGTKVVELRAKNSGTPIENLAKKNNLNYNSIIVDAKPIKYIKHPNQQGHIKVSVNSLSKILNN